MDDWSSEVCVFFLRDLSPTPLPSHVFALSLRSVIDRECLVNEARTGLPSGSSRWNPAITFSSNSIKLIVPVPTRRAAASESMWRHSGGGGEHEQSGNRQAAVCFFLKLFFSFPRCAWSRYTTSQFSANVVLIMFIFATNTFREIYLSIRLWVPSPPKEDL